MANSMRVLGLLCVAAALALSSGGVAYRIKADPQPQPGRVAPGTVTTPAEAEQTATSAADTGSCPAPDEAPPKPIVIKLERLPSAKEFISLNGSGYNYTGPGRIPTVLPEPASPESSSAEDEAGTSTAPASPRDF
jgi:hypothetical protein